jgi:hypothetical protein
MFASRAPHTTALVHSRVVPIAARCDCATPPAGSQHAGTPGAPPALRPAVIASSRDRLANVGERSRAPDSSIVPGSNATRRVCEHCHGWCLFARKISAEIDPFRNFAAKAVGAMVPRVQAIPP